MEQDVKEGDDEVEEEEKLPWEVDNTRRSLRIHQTLGSSYGMMLVHLWGQ